MARLRGEGSPQRRSHAGRVFAAALGVASAAGMGYALNHEDKPKSAATEQVLANSSLTPGAIDGKVRAPEICQSVWKQGEDGAPPVRGGTLTYSKAARHTSQKVKDAVFDEYGIENPHDGGKSYEIDHLVPLSLGGRDVQDNLWPESRTLRGMNAWAKDRLEFRLYNLLCHSKSGDPSITVKEAQDALRKDWTKAYEKYCGDDEDDCPAYGKEEE